MWLDLARSRLGRDIVEIDVGLEETLLHKLDRLILGSNLLLQFKIVVLLLEVGAAARHVLLVLVKSIAERLLAVLVDNLSFSLIDKFIPLLALSLFKDLADFGMGVINWC